MCLFCLNAPSQFTPLLIFGLLPSGTFICICLSMVFCSAYKRHDDRHKWGRKNTKTNDYSNNFNRSKKYDLWVKSDCVKAMIRKSTICDKPNIHKLGWNRKLRQWWIIQHLTYLQQKSLTMIIKWLNCNGCEMNFVIHKWWCGTFPPMMSARKLFTNPFQFTQTNNEYCLPLHS